MSNSEFRILLLLVFLTIQASGAAAGIPRSNCVKQCGNVSIPFPFGIGAGCFLDHWYEIVCQNRTVPKLNKIGLRVLNISLPNYFEYANGMISVSLPLIYSNASCGGEGLRGPVNFEGSQFVFSQTWNVFTSVGCNTLTTVNSTESAVVGCRSKCAGTSANIGGYSACFGRDECCQTTLPFNLQSFSVDFREEGEPQGCKYAFLADRSWFLRSNVTGLYDLSLNDTVPVVLEWGISNKTDYILKLIQQSNVLDDLDSFRCSRYSFYGSWSEMPFIQCYCRWGYRGNPYLTEGCQDINECEDRNLCPGICVNKLGTYDCVAGRKTPIIIGIGAAFGALVLCLVLWRLYKYVKKRREIKLKEKHFKRNGGLLLKSELSSPEGNVEKSKLFNSKDLEKATDNFNDDRILGQGGQGTVYKGMLTDGKIVAIKKSKVIDEGKVEQFINEVLILSQINHRNVVKLLGCCLETEVPLLVYEFIPNGTLYQYLHDPNQEFHVSWDTRLRIATEIAGALFYLHSAASIPIYHRDIKSTNILLDEKYRAKVADFGTSKSVSLDQTHVTTLVQGTFGYLDPEYFQSGQFTDKSDVYSFGVVLVELLTGQKPISSLREQEGRSLAMYFIISMEENCLFDIVDAQVLKEGKKEEIASVANLAKMCLNLNGRKRPAMKEVAMELEGIRKLRNPSVILQNQENHEATESYSAAFPSNKSNIDMDVITTSDVQPLLPSESWSTCAGTDTNTSQCSACSGRDGFCRATLLFNLQGINVDFKEEGGHQGFIDLRLNDTVPAVLEWGIPNNTKDALELIWQVKCDLRSAIAEGDMVVISILLENAKINPHERRVRAWGTTFVSFLWRLYKYIKGRKQLKHKEKYFKHNGALLLKSVLSSPEGDVEKSKLFNSIDLEKAVDNFNDDRIFGQGGEGILYKAMLIDGKIVAIKKSKVIDEGKVEQFINEVLIL
ncbi:LOW QUALITY PROTEIN: wall-associated receptor kinase-like 22 [Eucalyptus grandis]|uniref:LOW QUALITY PROTEIN: wall-associated receptor kinase-like 22 n=1 Tax=Eucalyptus grandis TaxID=71139 RepID=UPI00192E9447|nr:LOW QUALITY PROTEIN: wall-associated receptor kinase-like 22 [Eucalyptus grandis]